MTTAFKMRRVCIPACLIVAIIGAGCGKAGPKLAAVSGTVLLDGTPLTEGVVCFVSASGYVSSAPLDAEGRFRLVSQFGPGIPLSDYRVTVLPKPSDVSQMSMERSPTAHHSNIPTRYQVPAQSGLIADVQYDIADLRFQLTTSR